MKTYIMKSTWFLLCMLLFSYNAWRCVDQYLMFETVTKSSQERQELHEFPMICLGPENLPENRTGKLNMTPKDYWDGNWRTERMSEEEVYNNLSLHFEDLVEKVIITKTKMKYSRAYEKVIITNEDMDISGVRLDRSDYYWELKRNCLKFSHEIFPFGIQDVYFYMRNKDNVRFTVIPPGYGQDRKSNTFLYGKGMADYSVEHTLGYSLNLKRNPCSEEASWKEDDCPLGIIIDKIMETFNCTAPWLLNFTRCYVLKI